MTTAPKSSSALISHQLNPITCPGILSNKSVRGGRIDPPCFSGTNGPIILKFGMLMARTILMDFPLVPEQNIRNFRKNSGINIFPEFSGKSRIFEISVSLLININIYAFLLIILVGTTLKSHPNCDFGLFSQFLDLYFWTSTPCNSGHNNATV